MTISGVEPIELKRHAPVGRPRRAAAGNQPRGLAYVHASRKRRPLPDLFVTDQAEARSGGGFRWFFSTCLAAAVGTIAIGAVIFGSLDLSAGPGRMAASFRMAASPLIKRRAQTASADTGGLAWSIPKSDRLQTTMDSVSARYIVQDAIRERRASRAYIHNKPFARVMIRLAAVEPDKLIAIPPFNPLKLYANPASETSGSGADTVAAGPEGGEVTLRIIELLGSILPTEDGQELDTQEVTDLVMKSLAAEVDPTLIRPSFAPEGFDAATQGAGAEALAPNTTILAKTTSDNDEIDDEADGQKIEAKLGRGKSLSQMLVRLGAEGWQARDMVDAARSLLPEASVTSANSIEVTVVPKLSGSGKTEPSGYTVFGARGEHKVTVQRNSSGEFVASATQAQVSGSAANSALRATSLYSSLYHGALAQGIAPDTIDLILRVHAYEADFRRRARGSDATEMFFDLKDEDKGADGALGELLMTSLTIGGSNHKFYRFKDDDGVVDYYDPSGNNSRRFLLRKPVRSEEVRLTSGYGIRFHPLLNQRKLHAGIDWAGPPGTPIIAAGNGTIEEAGYKGQYGNYVRIRHANGYQTAYAHMRGFAPRTKAGVKIRQGEVIGYIGSTGLSSGPHLHFEVLVNSRWVDPLSIQVQREKRLAGRQLAAFQRERVRVDELMRRPPVRVRTVKSSP